MNILQSIFLAVMIAFMVVIASLGAWTVIKWLVKYVMISFKKLSNGKNYPE